MHLKIYQILFLSFCSVLLQSSTFSFNLFYLNVLILAIILNFSEIFKERLNAAKEYLARGNR